MLESTDDDILLKLFLIGPSNVGKSTLVSRFVTDSVTFDCQPTIGFDYKSKGIELEEKRVRLLFCDTAGQARFRFMNPADHYRGAMGLILVYDVTNEESFQELVHYWIPHIKEGRANDVNKIVVGTKCHLKSKKQVETIRGQTFADKYEMPFYEVSAETGENVKEAFICLASLVFNRLYGPSLLEIEEELQTVQIFLESTNYIPKDLIPLLLDYLGKDIKIVQRKKKPLWNLEFVLKCCS